MKKVKHFKDDDKEKEEDPAELKAIEQEEAGTTVTPLELTKKSVREIHDCYFSRPVDHLTG